jgi:hypothetical protein
MALSPRVARYTNGPPDLGYYYDALDYSVADMALYGKRHARHLLDRARATAKVVSVRDICYDIYNAACRYTCSCNLAQACGVTSGICQLVMGDALPACVRNFGRFKEKRLKSWPGAKNSRHSRVKPEKSAPSEFSCGAFPYLSGVPPQFCDSESERAPVLEISRGSREKGSAKIFEPFKRKMPRPAPQCPPDAPHAMTTTTRHTPARRAAASPARPALTAAPPSQTHADKKSAASLNLAAP